MRAKFLLPFSLAFLSAHSIAQTKDQQIIDFWKKSDYRFTNKLIPDFSRVIYFNTVKRYYPAKSYTDVIDKAGDVRNDSALQDFMFLSFLELYGNGENLKRQMADMCGTYILGNYIANYIVKRYSKDKRYLKMLAQKKKDIQIKDSVNNDEEIKENNK